MENKNWNPFLNLVIRLKRSYETKFKKACCYEQIERKVNCTCINAWLSELNDDTYTNAFSGLLLWQYGNYITAHYVDYYTAINCDGRRVDYKDFFHIYDGLYMECRGVMIDVLNEELVLVPFRKFKNLDECPETSLNVIKKMMKDAKTIEFTDKMDGSMISAGIHHDRLCISGSSCNHPDVSVYVKNSYDYINTHDMYLKMINEHPEYTFIFEHIFPMIDKHLVKYKESGLYLIGIREKDTGKEYDYKSVLKMAEKYGVKATKIVDITLPELLNQLDNKTCTEAEGFVLNIDGFKVKIKYNDYVKISKTILGTATPNQIIKAMADGTIDDFIAKTPEVYKEQIFDHMAEINRLVSELNDKVLLFYKNIKDIPKKEAMIWIDHNVPKELKSFVRNIYKKEEMSYFKTTSGHVRTYLELKELAKLHKD